MLTIFSHVFLLAVCDASPYDNTNNFLSFGSDALHSPLVSLSGLLPVGPRCTSSVEFDTWPKTFVPDKR